MMCLLNSGFVCSNSPSGLYDFDKYEIGHKFLQCRWEFSQIIPS